MNRAQSIKAEAKTQVLSSAEREGIAAAISRSASASAGQINAPVVHVSSAGATSLVLNVEFTSEAARLNFALPGATVFAAAGPFAEMFVKPTDEVIEALVNVPDIRRIEPDTPIKLPPPPVLLAGVASRGLSEQIVSGGISGLTGKSVIFAILDSGLDFRNADFVDSSGPLPRSRLLYFWDTLSDAFESKGLGIRPPVDYPNGRPIGTLYTRAQLTADLRMPVKLRQIPSPDENGHGTAAASIAVGNGRNSPADDKHIGVAPDADIIAVRIGDAEGTMPEGFLLNAIVAWLDKAAREAREPVVISCSFGGHFTGHDGASRGRAPLERALCAGSDRPRDCDCRGQRARGRGARQNKNWRQKFAGSAGLDESAGRRDAENLFAPGALRVFSPGEFELRRHQIVRPGSVWKRRADAAAHANTKSV